MANLSETHNAIAKAALEAIIVPTLKADGDDTASLMAAESVLLGVILFNEAHFKVERRTSAELVEVLAERVLERLAAIPHGGGNG